MMPTESNLSNAATNLLPVSLMALRWRGAINAAAPIIAKSFRRFFLSLQYYFPVRTFLHFLRKWLHHFHQSASDGQTRSSSRFAVMGFQLQARRGEHSW